MRVFTISAIAFAVLLIIVFVYQAVSSKAEQDILSLTSVLEKGIAEENINSVSETFASLQDKWKSTRKLLMAVSEHSDLDRVEEHVKNIGSELKYENFEDAYKEVQLFKMLLHNIFSISQPTLTNIL
ncbi:MAG: DUF4363 family protein [Clostridia bacterium]|nr:DUF4363 family protein [Clostridia bacterium]